MAFLFALLCLVMLLYLLKRVGKIMIIMVSLNKLYFVKKEMQFRVLKR